MLFQEQFERIKAVYPGTSYVCLLDGDSGDMMCVRRSFCFIGAAYSWLKCCCFFTDRAQSETTEVNTDEFTRTIINLKDAALQFGVWLCCWCWEEHVDDWRV